MTTARLSRYSISELAHSRCASGGENDSHRPHSILWQEGHGDVFAIHPWDPDRDGESSSDDSAGPDDHIDGEIDMELF